VWKIQVPPRIHVFLWLLANDKGLTRDNLTKRRHVEDMSCLFRNDEESISHVFFECCGKIDVGNAARSDWFTSDN
jgi:hypothetical protein